MGFIKQFKHNHGDLFVYLPAEEVHPHDHFLDRVLLRWLPEWITPNRITIFRILTTPIVFFLTLNGFYKAGIVSFLLVASTDAMDGSLARTQNKITKFGMLIDPLADKFLVGSMILVLVFRYLNPWLGVAILGIEVIFIVSALVARIRFKTVKMANRWGKIKMFLQVLAMCSIMFGLVLDVPFLLSFATGVLGLAIGFAIVSLFKHGL
ncbi:MAG TPA: CDP-alcohol phosphatidyltransferase family protein [Candidatus Magasanikbacteria bacterium]|nr:CDP-alcohol phosphatidyltransferase family protein [Candidatus Magasanikbacteria bacterium]